MQLLKIDNVDFTNNIVVPTYSINKNNMYITWTDANHIDHQYLTRTKVSGSFTAFFDSVSTLNLFLETIEKNRTKEGYIPNCLVYCNNTETVELIDIFVDFITPGILPVVGTSKNETFEVTISQR